MIIETWDVSKYNYVIVFILSCYLVGGMIYFFKTYKESVKKTLIQLSIGAIIVLTGSYIATTYGYKTVNIVYQYKKESEIQFLMSRGWTLVESSEQYHRAHLKKDYKTGRTKIFYPNGGKDYENYK